MLNRAVSHLRVRINRDPRDWIVGMLPAHPVCAEVGVWKGNFAERLLRLARPSRYYLIDPWRYVPETGSKLYGQGGQTTLDAIHDSVRRRFARDPVVILRMASVEAANQIPDASLDLAYIDGDHTYAGCLADLRAFWPKLKHGALLIADDYGLDDRWWGDGVTRAAHDFSAEAETAMIEQRDYQAVFRKPG